MEKPFRTIAVHAALCQHMRSQPDVGAFKAAADLVLEPGNPFEPKAARAPRRWFVFFALIATILLACFAYFTHAR